MLLLFRPPSKPISTNDDNKVTRNMALRLLRSQSASIHGLPGLFDSSSSSKFCLEIRAGQFSLPCSPWGSIGNRRTFTATQAAAALRPFYFAVHPDLFGPYPEMYRTNEQSLKALNGYIDGLYAERRPASTNLQQQHQPNPVVLKFFVRERKQHQQKDSTMIKSVELNLKEKDPCAAVRNILETCNLPTEHLPRPIRLPWRTIGVEKAAERRSDAFGEPADDEELIQFWSSSKKKKSTVETGGLLNWLQKMAPEAHRLRSEHDATEMDVKRKIDEIKDETGLTDIGFNLSWTLTHCRGCLQLFRRALITNTVPLVNLKGWILKFGRHGTYVSLDRSIVLGVDDLPSDWIALIYNLNSPRSYYGGLAQLERRVSELLGNAVISGPSSTPVRRYKSRLVTLADRLSGVDTVRRYKLSDYSKLCLVIENESCGLVLMENGRISVPFTVLPSVLYDFLESNREAAIDSTTNYKSTKDELASLKRQCMQKWKLDTIEWGDWGLVNHHAVKTCLERLVSGFDNDHQEEQLKSMLNGHRLHIGPQETYVVLPDGRLSIPCDWKL